MPSEICGKGNVFVYNFCMGFFLVFIPGSLCVFLIKASIMGRVKAGGLCRYREKLRRGMKEIKRELWIEGGKGNIIFHSLVHNFLGFC